MYQRRAAKICIDPWGKACKLAMSQIKGPKATQPTVPLLMQEKVSTLYPPRRRKSSLRTT